MMAPAEDPNTSTDDDHQEKASSSSTFYALHNEGRQIIKAAADDNNRNSFSKLLFENERIQVWDFRLPSQQSVLISHDMSTIRWQVDEGLHKLDVVVLAANEEEVAGKQQQQTKEEEGVVVPDRKVFYVKKGTKWNLTNTGNNIYRQSVFCFKSEIPKYTEQQVQQLFQQAIYSTNNIGTELLFENELCRVWDFYLHPGEGGDTNSVHHHCLDYVFINVAPSRLLGLDPETLDLNNLLFDSISEDNQVTWNTIPETAPKDKSFAHGGKNGYDDRPMREYLVELK